MNPSATAAAAADATTTGISDGRSDRSAALSPRAEPAVETRRSGSPRLDLSLAAVLRRTPWDLLFVALALAHGWALLQFPSIPLVAIGLWWNANTIAHNFIHRPFFRSPVLNAMFSAYESLLLGIPQRLWRDRHLAHHAGRPWRWRRGWQLVGETVLMAALWCGLGASAPGLFLKVYLPGWLLGVGLCHLQGHFEHAGSTTSHYGRVYNLLFFNDGFHREHHARPGTHWRDLPKLRRAETEARASRWPAILRWLEWFNLDGLERLVLRSETLQRAVLESHQRAFQTLLPELGSVRRVGIVGGGMFPRTALILQRLLPDAHLTVIDANAGNLSSARRFVGRNVQFVNEFFAPAPRRGLEKPSPPAPSPPFDLLIIPLAFSGDRQAIYVNPPAPAVLVHDWLWHRLGRGVRISWALLKRLNLVKRPASGEGVGALAGCGTDSFKAGPGPLLEPPGSGTVVPPVSRQRGPDTRPSMGSNQP